jgi:hypothetical protein
MKKLVGIAVLALLGSFAAYAGSVTYTASYGPNPTDYAHTLALNLWDPALFPGQVLTGITLHFGINDDILSVHITNTSTIDESNFDAKSGSQVTITNDSRPDGFSMIDLTLFDSGTISLGHTGGACATATPTLSCNDVTYNPTAVNGSENVTVPTAHFSLYEGSGTFTITGSTQFYSSFIGGGGNLAFTQATNATMSASVTYDYADAGTPEPATMALMGSALIGIGLLGRKRTRK